MFVHRVCHSLTEKSRKVLLTTINTTVTYFLWAKVARGLHSDTCLVHDIDVLMVFVEHVE